MGFRCRLRRNFFICFRFCPRLKFWKCRSRLLLGLEPRLTPYFQNRFPVFSVINSFYRPKKLFTSAFKWFVVSIQPQASGVFALRSVANSKAIAPHYLENFWRRALWDRRLP